MENTSQMLLRHEDELCSRRWLLLDADDPALSALPGTSRHWHSDRPDGAAQTSAMLPTLPADVDLVIVVLPKSLPRLSFLVASIAGQLTQPVELWLVGPAKGGIKGGVSTLAKAGVELASTDSARHCKLFSGTLSPAEFRMADFQQTFDLDGLAICSLPGVFSSGRLDAGTALLLEALSDQMKSGQSSSGSALDLGCGAGVLSAWLARAGLAVSAVDISATAVEATRLTLAANSLSGSVRQSDLFSAVDDRFDLLVTNPPFHQGRAQTFEVTQRLVQQAPDHLLPGGQLWLVANRHLPYDDWLQSSFNRVSVKAQNNAFTVYCAGR